MSDILKASHDLQVLAAKFRAILEVSEALGRIGSLEEAERNALTRKMQAREDETKATAAMGVAQMALENVLKSVEATKASATSIVAEANRQANQTRGQATLDGEVIVAEANRKKSDVAQEIETLRQSKEAVLRDLETKQKELSAITSQIAETKARIAQLAG